MMVWSSVSLRVEQMDFPGVVCWVEPRLAVMLVGLLVSVKVAYSVELKVLRLVELKAAKKVGKLVA